MAELRERIVKEPKDLAEVYDAVEGILGAALGPDKLADLTAQLPKLMSAADGFKQALAEMKADEVYECSGAFVGRVTKIVIDALKPEPPPADPAAA